MGFLTRTFVRYIKTQCVQGWGPASQSETVVDVVQNQATISMYPERKLEKIMTWSCICLQRDRSPSVANADEISCNTKLRRYQSSF